MSPSPCLNGCTIRGKVPLTWDNGSAPGGAGNTTRGLTHRLDPTERQAAMKGTRTCTVEGCGRRVQARGFCNTHYSRWRKTGTPTAPSRPTLAERLWSRVAVTPGGCWEFTGSRNAARGGYGRIRADRPGVRRVIHAHVAAWEVTRGPVPTGMVVRHRCDNPPCCNPDHLELGTYADNSQDMADRGRRLTGERNPVAVLTVDQVREIRRRFADKEPRREIAERFKVSTSLVYMIANRRIWKGVA